MPKKTFKFQVEIDTEWDDEVITKQKVTEDIRNAVKSQIEFLYEYGIDSDAIVTDTDVKTIYE